MRRWHVTMAAVVAVLGSALAVTMTAQQRAESHDMTLVGSNDLQARSAYQPVIQKQGDRWIAYIGHHAGSMPNLLTGFSNGTSVIDVTNPGNPNISLTFRRWRSARSRAGADGAHLHRRRPPEGR